MLQDVTDMLHIFWTITNVDICLWFGLCANAEKMTTRHQNLKFFIFVKLDVSMKSRKKFDSTIHYPVNFFFF